MSRLPTLLASLVLLVSLGVSSHAFAALIQGQPDYTQQTPGFPSIQGVISGQQPQDPLVPAPSSNSQVFIQNQGNVTNYGGSASSPPGSGGTGNCGAGQICIQNPTPYSDLMTFIKGILNGVVRILMPIIALMFIWTGFLFVTAGGSEEKLKTAKDALVGTIIGAAIVLGAWALAVAISATIGSIGVPS